MRSNPKSPEQLAYPCLTCGAAPGQWCVTSSGWWAPYLHSNRFYAWRADVAASDPAPTGEPTEAQR